MLAATAALFCAQVEAQITNVIIGTTPNDGTGDPLRTAFLKLNTNLWWVTNNFQLLNEVRPVTNNNTANSFTGSGAGLSNITDNGSVNVMDKGAVGDGSTDDTAAFNAALATGKSVWAPPGHSYVVSNLILTNNGIFSTGARLVFKASSSNFFIQFAPIAVNPSYTGIATDWGHSFLKGLILDGGNGTNIPTANGTRHAVWFDPYQTNNFMEDVTITGFNGWGFFEASSRPFAGAAGQPAISYPTYGMCRNCRAFYCWRGVELFEGTVPFVGGNGSDAYYSEYTTTTGWQCDSNACGIEVMTGNHFIANCIFNANVTAANIIGTVNEGHGEFTGCTFNHSISNGVMATNVAFGEKFTGCTFFGTATTTNYWKGNTSIYWDGGIIAGGAWILDGNTMGAIRWTYTTTTFAAPAFTHLNSDSVLTYMNDNPGGGNTAPDKLPYQVMPSTQSNLTVTNLTIGGSGASMTFTPGSKMDGITTAGAGLPYLIQDANIGTNLSGTFANVPLVTVTNGGIVIIFCDLQSTHSGTAGTLTEFFNYTDQFGVAQTTASISITVGAAGGSHTNGIFYVKCLAGSAIGVTTTLSGGGGGSTWSTDTSMLQASNFR